MVDTAGFPKDIYYFYQSHWNHDGPAMAHIVPMDWTSWWAGQTVPVFVYSNCDSVQFVLNGASLGSQPGGPSVGHFSWNVSFASLEPYKGTSRSAFSGKAMAIVRSLSTAGTIHVSAALPVNVAQGKKLLRATTLLQCYGARLGFDGREDIVLGVRAGCRRRVRSRDVVFAKDFSHGIHAHLS